MRWHSLSAANINPRNAAVYSPTVFIKAFICMHTLVGTRSHTHFLTCVTVLRQGNEAEVDSKYDSRSLRRQRCRGQSILCNGFTVISL